jgi:DUF1009 family protein
MDFDPDKNRVAIIAGNGQLPAEIKGELDRGKLKPVLIGINGEIDPALAGDAMAVLTYGQVGQLFKLLADHQVRHVIFAGGIRKRPDYSQLKMDMVTVRELPTLLKIVLGGDNSVLSKIAKYFATRKIDVLGAHQLVPQLLADEGIIAGRPSMRKLKPVLAKAREAAKQIGALDIGQAVIAEDGRVLALEAVEGTDAMIGRVAQLRAEGRLSAKPEMGILLKAMKPGQDMRADLPAIGPGTIIAVNNAGLKGIAVEAGRSLILERERTLDLARQHNIFIIGFDAEDFG